MSRSGVFATAIFVFLVTAAEARAEWQLHPNVPYESFQDLAAVWDGRLVIASEPEFDSSIIELHVWSGSSWSSLATLSPPGISETTGAEQSGDLVAVDGRLYVAMEGFVGQTYFWYLAQVGEGGAVDYLDSFTGSHPGLRLAVIPFGSQLLSSRGPACDDGVRLHDGTQWTDWGRPVARECGYYCELTDDNPCSGSVATAATYRGETWFGGFFELAGGAPARGLARGEGATWTGIGLELGGYGARVVHMGVVADRLIVTGKFDAIGSADVTDAAAYDGVTWEQLELPAEVGVPSAGVTADGVMYLAFPRNGVEGYPVYAYDGASWRSLGEIPAPYGTVDKMRVNHGRLWSVRNGMSAQLASHWTVKVASIDLSTAVRKGRKSFGALRSTYGGRP